MAGVIDKGFDMQTVPAELVPVHERPRTTAALNNTISGQSWPRRPLPRPQTRLLRNHTHDHNRPPSLRTVSPPTRRLAFPSLAVARAAFPRLLVARAESPTSSLPSTRRRQALWAPLAQKCGDEPHARHPPRQRARNSLGKCLGSTTWRSRAGQGWGWLHSDAGISFEPISQPPSQHLPPRTDTQLQVITAIQYFKYMT